MIVKPSGSLSYIKQLKMEICSICLNTADANCVLLNNCNHLFCHSCIFEWILIKNTCPYCRTEVSNDEIICSYEYGVSKNIIIKGSVIRIDVSNLSLSEQEIIVSKLGVITGIIYKSEWRRIMDKIISDKVLTDIFQKTNNKETECYHRSDSFVSKQIYYFVF